MNKDKNYEVRNTTPTDVAILSLGSVIDVEVTDKRTGESAKGFSFTGDRDVAVTMAKDKLEKK